MNLLQEEKRQASFQQITAATLDVLSTPAVQDELGEYGTELLREVEHAELASFDNDSIATNPGTPFMAIVPILDTDPYEAIWWPAQRYDPRQRAAIEAMAGNPTPKTVGVHKIHDRAATAMAEISQIGVVFGDQQQVFTGKSMMLATSRIRHYHPAEIASIVTHETDHLQNYGKQMIQVATNYDRSLSQEDMGRRLITLSEASAFAVGHRVLKASGVAALYSEADLRQLCRDLPAHEAGAKLRELTKCSKPTQELHAASTATLALAAVVMAEVFDDDAPLPATELVAAYQAAGLIRI